MTREEVQEIVSEYEFIGPFKDMIQLTVVESDTESYCCKVELILTDPTIYLDYPDGIRSGITVAVPSLIEAKPLVHSLISKMIDSVLVHHYRHFIKIPDSAYPREVTRE